LIGYAKAQAVVEAEDRFAMATAVRVAVWGKPEDMRSLRPVPRRADGSPDTDIEYDEDGLAEELASLGFIEVPRDE
jgi:hypothetical protein